MSRRRIHATADITNIHGVRIQCKVYRDTEWNEYRVRVYVNGTLDPDLDAFETDRASAIATADTIASSDFSTTKE